MTKAKPEPRNIDDLLRVLTEDEVAMVNGTIEQLRADIQKQENTIAGLEAMLKVDHIRKHGKPAHKGGRVKGVSLAKKDRGFKDLPSRVMGTPDDEEESPISGGVADPPPGSPAATVQADREMQIRRYLREKGARKGSIIAADCNIPQGSITVCLGRMANKGIIVPCSEGWKLA